MIAYTPEISNANVKMSTFKLSSTNVRITVSAQLKLIDVFRRVHVRILPNNNNDKLCVLF